MSEHAREEALAEFAQGRADVLVTTGAFAGMIHRPDLRMILHDSFPPSIDDYCRELVPANQATGEVQSVILYSPADRITNELLIQSLNPGDDPVTAQHRHKLKQKLHAMTEYLTTRECRRVSLACYFGTSEPEPCGNCDNCAPRALEASCFSPEAKELARLVIKCVAAVDGRFGRTRVAQILAGSRARPIVRMNLHELPFHGRLAQYTRGAILDLFDDLIAGAALDELELAENRPVLRLTERGASIASGDAEVDFPVRVPERRGQRTSASARKRAQVVARCIAGATPPECAEALKLSTDKVWKHLLDAVAEGALTDPEGVIDPERRRTVLDALERLRKPSVKVLQKVLPAGFSANEIRFILARSQDIES